MPRGDVPGPQVQERLQRGGELRLGPKNAGAAGCVPVEQLCPKYGKKMCSKKNRKSKCSWKGSSCVADLGPTPVPVPPTPSAGDMACGALPTKDPRVFGPNMWHAIHIMGQWIAVPGRDDMRALCNDFVAALPMMLPDPVSGANILDFIKGHREGRVARAGTSFAPSWWKPRTISAPTPRGGARPGL